MKTRAESVARLPASVPAERTWTAEIARIDDEGRVFVKARGAAEHAVLILNGGGELALAPGVTVLLLGNDEDPSRPILLGAIADRLGPPADAEPEHTPGAQINARSVHVRGEDKISLTCGRSSLTLNRDGSVVVRGTRIVSRASETNRIKGGAVKIN